MALANVALTDTFDQWRTVTNQVITSLNNPFVYFGTANANTISITQNVSRQGNVFINVMTTSAVSDQSTSNIASIYAVNTVSTRLVTVYDLANVIYGFSNTINTFAYGVAVNTNAAFSQANAFSIVVSNTKPTAVQGSVWWHNELGKLFVYYKDGDTDQWVDTSPAYDVSYIEDLTNVAYNSSNAAFSAANAAYVATNVAYNASNVSYSQANAAFNRANNAAQPFGGGSDAVFFLNDAIVSSSYSIPTNKNAMTAGPLEINSGATVTINVGSTWTIV